ncbi:MAG TPA: 4-(cytidine 5'-diphospho)-2-C-methyl-D-erythritol kinase [Alphaproteobacteria bacterium]|nr:4-(cytidine 5'-diphospho)-2-C-methyl-D-erythritol kinase [Alphaproteobacteria bacterium]
MTNSVSELAPAKINLFLHILGRRPDGYHELQSLVVFADTGDVVHAEAAPEWSLRIDGPFAEKLAAETPNDNLILRAARRLPLPTGQAAALTLDKRLPVAAGIGGGSADAAATLRSLHRLLGADLGEPAEWADLGGDIPVCLDSQPSLVESMGEKVQPAHGLPDLPAVLVNPAVPSGTGAVFQALNGRFGAPHPAPLPSPAICGSIESLAAWLAEARNDLTRPAIEITPSIGEVLAALSAAPDALLARMSGSGATCYGLFPSARAAAEAALWIASRAPGWWVKPAILRGSPSV